MNANDAYTEFENALNNIINSIAPEKKQLKYLHQLQ